MSNIFTQLTTSDTNGNLDLGTFLLCVVCSIVIGFVISLVYIQTHKKNGFDQSYVFTIVVLPAVICAIIMLVGNSMAQAFSLAGVFSLVRFRSAPNDPSDICYIFFSVATGLACGMGYPVFGFILLAILGVVIVVISKLDYGKPETQHMTLKVTIPEDLHYQGLFDATLNKYCTNWSLRRVKTVEFGSLFDLVFNVEVKDVSDQKAFMDELRTLNGNLNITLVLSRKDDKLYA